VAQIPTLEEFRRMWVRPQDRRELMAELPDGGRAPLLVRSLEGRADFDLYDVLADLAYGANPLSRPERGDAFGYKHGAWLAAMPPQAGATVQALIGQFVRSGVEGLENPRVFQIPEVTRVGGLQALRFIGSPADVLEETKLKLFAA
jgi:type I restriction enzyme, R subunit